MPSRRYKVFKFNYYSDNGNIYIKRQREYHENLTDRVLTPITNTFLGQVVPDNNKVDSFDSGMRHTLSYIEVNDNPTNNIGEFKSYLPFAPTDTRLKQHIIEITDLNRVICADYVGEDTTYDNRK